MRPEQLFNSHNSHITIMSAPIDLEDLAGASGPLPSNFNAGPSALMLAAPVRLSLMLIVCLVSPNAEEAPNDEGQSRRARLAIPQRDCS